MTVATTENAEVLGQYDIGAGDTLVIRMHPNSIGAWQATALTKAVTEYLRLRGHIGINALVLPPAADLALLSPAEMQAHGWVPVGSERKGTVEDFAHFCANRFADGTDIGAAPVSYYESLATEYLAED